ncbi:MAG: glycosyltransferase family 39 protein [Thermodesulfobacteriota bacterium]
MKCSRLHDKSQMAKVSRLDCLACFTILAFLLFLAWFGAQFHYVEMCYSTEYDRYVEKVDQIRGGTLPSDIYHPLFYPLVAAGVSLLLGDTFTAARTVSTLSAGGVLILTYLIGVKCFSRKVALLGTVALALNALFFMCGFEAAADMLFSLLGLACLLLAMVMLERPQTLTVIALGGCFSLAFVTRYAAVAMVPSLLLMLWLSPFQSRRQRVTAALTLAITVSICLSMQMAVNTYTFGGPFKTGAISILETKLSLHGIAPATKSPTTDGLTGFMLSHPVLVLVSLAKSLREWIVDGMAGVVGGNQIFLASAVFTFTLLGGVCTSVTKTNPKISLCLAYMAGHFLVICLVLMPIPRYLLPILPLCLLMSVNYAIDEYSNRSWRFGEMATSPRILALAIFLVLLPVGAVPLVSDMLLRHPYKELEAAKSLETFAGRNVVVAGTFPFMQRYVRYRYRHSEGDFGSEGPEARTHYFATLRSELKESGSDYLIVSPPSIGQRPPDLLTGRDLPDYLQPHVLHPDVVVYRVIKAKL